MASSSLRRSRMQSLNARNKTFRTTIDPNKDIIDIPVTFKSAWLNELYEHPWGILCHPNGKKAMLELHLENNDSYFINGKSAALLFGIRTPTDVNFHYQVEHNNFTLSLIKHDDVVDVSSDDDAEKIYISDTDDYNLWEHNNDRVFGWEVHVTEAYSSGNQGQVLHIPAKCAKNVLRGKKSIFIRTLHNMDHIQCTINLYTRKVGGKIKKEMRITHGWYEFQQANDLKCGDLLKCQLSDPPEVLVINIVRGGATKQDTDNGTA